MREKHPKVPFLSASLVSHYSWKTTHDTGLTQNMSTPNFHSHIKSVIKQNKEKQDTRFYSNTKGGL